MSSRMPWPIIQLPGALWPPKWPAGPKPQSQISSAARGSGLAAASSSAAWTGILGAAPSRARRAILRRWRAALSRPINAPIEWPTSVIASSSSALISSHSQSASAPIEGRSAPPLRP